MVILAMKQLGFFDKQNKGKRSDVHQPEKGKRKTARPLSKTRPIHLVLKSKYILMPHRFFLEKLIQALSFKFGITNYRHSINGDHLHFAIKIPNKVLYKKFIRAFTGITAKKIGKGMWVELPFTRVANWGRDFKNLLAYIKKNHEETWILRKYEPRKWNQKKKFTGQRAPPATLAPCVLQALENSPYADVRNLYFRSASAS
jgi:hypothetical protein